jgi:hypothetical protein
MRQLSTSGDHNMSSTTVTKSKARKSPAVSKTIAAQVLSAPDTKISIDSTDRQQLIAAAAYLKAEARGFQGGDSMSDWLAAEAEIDAQYSIPR